MRFSAVAARHAPLQFQAPDRSLEAERLSLLCQQEQEHSCADGNRATRRRFRGVQ